MTDRNRPDPAAGWGDSLPLPLTPETPPGPARGDVAHAKRAIRRASLEDGAPPTDTVEVGGPKGLEPTRYRDWEQKGRCTDF
ncbi:succinate dehydrogenase assembly factor 4 [Roseospira navarrensis]|uniref:DUF1674 domain-containing protein n=1 Tax=Roseospira navarrensis TaxID=140058 RepID=A0A7X2D441_9PROT|nr:succinate dehydrogenase assembly factor 4 [Roseospira navarrensis]MQX35800.1 DUF1674 domain-containing protein [Roseospira navarrensis]